MTKENSEDSAKAHSRERSGKGPVFIVGMNGSGTTMLLDCLNNHPDFYGFPLETKILPLYLRKLAKYGDLKVDANFARLWNDLRRIIYFRSTNGGAPPPLPSDWAERERTFAAALDGVFRHFADREGKTRWCEKSPMYALHMDEFGREFPDARFIHMIRDGRDCAHSFRRRYRYTPQKTMHRWKTVVRKARKMGATLGDRYLEVRYEDLTDAPAEYMRRICAFLGADYTDAVLTIGRPRSDQKTLARTIVPNKEKWRKAFGTQEIEVLDRIGGCLLADLGYPSVHPESDWDPPKATLKYWGYRDNVRRAAASLWTMIVTPDWRRRRLMFDKLVTNIRHKTNVGFQ